MKTTTTTNQVATGWQRIEDQDGRAQYLPVKTPQRRPPALVKAMYLAAHAPGSKAARPDRSRPSPRATKTAQRVSP
jgi:hypothetical protein